MKEIGSDHNNDDSRNDHDDNDNFDDGRMASSWFETGRVEERLSYGLIHANGRRVEYRQVEFITSDSFEVEEVVNTDVAPTVWADTNSATVAIYGK